MYLSSPIVLVRLVSTCCLQYIHVNGIHCVSECVMSSSGGVMRPGHCDNNNFPALSPNNPLRHGADTQEMGTVWRKAAMRGECWPIRRLGEGVEIMGGYQTTSLLPTLVQHQLIVWTVVKLLQLPRSLGHLASIKLGGVHWSWRWMDNGTGQQWWSLHQFISNTESN